MNIERSSSLDVGMYANAFAGLKDYYKKAEVSDYSLDAYDWEDLLERVENYDILVQAPQNTEEIFFETKASEYLKYKIKSEEILDGPAKGTHNCPIEEHYPGGDLDYLEFQEDIMIISEYQDRSEVAKRIINISDEEKHVLVAEFEFDCS